MSIECRVSVRHNLSREEYRDFGIRLMEWYAKEEVAAEIDLTAVEDLIDGERPKPQLARITQKIREFQRIEGDMEDPNHISPELLKRLESDLGPSAAVQFFRLNCGGFDRAAAIASLKKHIPARYVEELLVGGTSWNDCEMAN